MFTRLLRRSAGTLSRLIPPRFTPAMCISLVPTSLKTETPMEESDSACILGKDMAKYNKDPKPVVRADLSKGEVSSDLKLLRDLGNSDTPMEEIDSVCILGKDKVKSFEDPKPVERADLSKREDTYLKISPAKPSLGMSFPREDIELARSLTMEDIQRIRALEEIKIMRARAQEEIENIRVQRIKQLQEAESIRANQFQWLDVWK